MGRRHKDGLGTVLLNHDFATEEERAVWLNMLLDILLLPETRRCPKGERA